MLTASDLFPVGLALGYLAALTLDAMPVCRGGPDASLLVNSGGTQT